MSISYFQCFYFFYVWKDLICCKYATLVGKKYKILEKFFKILKYEAASLGLNVTFGSIKVISAWRELKEHSLLTWFEVVCAQTLLDLI